MLVHSRMDSGLVIASEAADESSIRRALKQHDPDLCLTPDIDPENRMVVWTVMKRVGEQRHIVMRWRGEHGAPLPLSHGLVEQVKRLDLNSRAPREDTEAHNDRLVAAHREAAEEEIEWYSRELVRQLQGKSSAILPRGVHRRRTAFSNVTDVR